MAERATQSAQLEQQREATNTTSPCNRRIKDEVKHDEDASAVTRKSSRANNRGEGNADDWKTGSWGKDGKRSSQHAVGGQELGTAFKLEVVPVAGLEWMFVGEGRPSLVRFGAKGAAGRFFVGRVGSELSPKPYFEGVESHHSWVFGARAGIRGMLSSPKPCQARISLPLSGVRLLL